MSDLVERCPRCNGSGRWRQGICRACDGHGTLVSEPVFKVEFDDLQHHEQLAIAFIGRNASDTIGVIDSEEKMAAALTYIDLVKRGYLIASITPLGPSYRLTMKGKRAFSAVKSTLPA